MREPYGFPPLRREKVARMGHPAESDVALPPGDTAMEIGHTASELFFEELSKRLHPRRDFGPWSQGLRFEAKRAWEAMQDACGPDPKPNSLDTAARMVAQVLNGRAEKNPEESA